MAVQVLPLGSNRAFETYAAAARHGADSIDIGYIGSPMHARVYCYSLPFTVRY